MPRQLALRAIFLSLIFALSACSSSSDVIVGPGGGDPPPPPPSPEVDSTESRTRYEFNNRCVVLQSLSNSRFVAASGAGFAASASAISGAEAFYFKPTALGDYLLFTKSGNLLTANTPITSNPLSAATNANIITVNVLGDTTNYIKPPVTNREPTEAEITAYRSFVDPLLSGKI